MFAVTSAYPFFVDSNGPLNGGSLYFGVAGDNPETNPVTVYWDLAGTQPAAQPVKTLNGYPARLGTPANLFVNGDYSLTIRSASGTIVSTSSSNAGLSFAETLAGGSGASLIGHDYTQSYPVSTVGAALTGVVNLAEVPGVDRTGVTDSTAAINAATAVCKRVYAPEGTYLVNALTLRTDMEFFGDGDSTILRPLTSATNFALAFDSGSADPANNITNLYIHDLQLRGWSDTAGLSQHLHLVSLNGVSNAKFERVTFRASRGDGCYVGTGVNTGTERHNFHITFRKCHFDGVNHSNRNGITFIDIEGAVVEDCLFENLTDPTMPGAIDVEPDQAYNVVRDIVVRDSYFTACGGFAGFFCLSVAPTLTTPASGFLVDGNTVDSAGYYATDADKGLQVGITGDADSTRFPLDFMVSNNTFRNMGYLFRLNGSTDVTFRDNHWLTSIAGGHIGDLWKCLNTTIDHNVFYQSGSDLTNGGSGVVMYTTSFCTISRNRFNNVGKSDASQGYAIEFATGTTDDIAIVNNQVTGANTTYAIRVIGTLTPASNLMSQNGFGSFNNDFLAGFGSKSWTPGTIGSQAQAITTVTATGARLGQPAMCSFSLDQSGIIFTAYVSSNDTITVIAANNTGSPQTFGAGTLSAWTIQP